MTKCPVSGGKHDYATDNVCRLCGWGRILDARTVRASGPNEPATLPRSEFIGLATSPQPAPTPASGDVWLLVMSDMEQRRQHGIGKYGTPVQVDNGRDHLIDAYQECLDLCVYLRAEIEKRTRSKP